MRITQGISPLAVANYLLEKNKHSQCLGMDQMKLIYLVYQCHGLHLAEYNAPLVNELVEAWKYGPIFPSIYQETKDTGTKPLTKPFDDPSGDQLTAQQKQLADEVYADHCKFDGIELMLKTHEKGTPWHDTYVMKLHINFPIPNSLIHNYFSSMLFARREAQNVQYA